MLGTTKVASTQTYSMYCIASLSGDMGPSRILIPVVTPSEEFAFRFGKNNQGRGEHEREIKRLRPAMAVPASHLETEIERPDIAEAGSTAQLSAGLSNYWGRPCARGAMRDLPRSNHIFASRIACRNRIQTGV